MRLKISLVVLLTAAGLIAAGCGDDDEETTSTGASGATGATGEAGAGLLPADFAAEADAICKEGDQEIDAEADDTFGQSQKQPSQAEQEKFFAETVLPSVEGQIDDLAALGDPDEGSEELSTFLDDAQSVLDDVEEDPSLLSGKEDPFADVEKQAKELGLKECAG